MGSPGEIKASYNGSEKRGYAKMFGTMGSTQLLYPLKYEEAFIVTKEIMVGFM